MSLQWKWQCSLIKWAIYCKENWWWTSSKGFSTVLALLQSVIRGRAPVHVLLMLPQRHTKDRHTHTPTGKRFHMQSGVIAAQPQPLHLGWRRQSLEALKTNDKMCWFGETQLLFLVKMLLLQHRRRKRREKDRICLVVWNWTIVRSETTQCTAHHLELTLILTFIVCTQTSTWPQYFSLIEQHASTQWHCLWL